MSFRVRTLLRLLFSLLAAVALTGLAMSTLPAKAQSEQPLFVNTGAKVYAVNPFLERVTALDIPGTPLSFALSPDGARLLVDAQAGLPPFGRAFFLVDTESLAVTELPLAHGGMDIGGMPYWRWDSQALLYSGKLPDHRPSVYHYHLDFDRIEVWATDIPVWGDGGEGLNIPPVVWWDEEGFALLQNNLSPSADLLPYTSEGRKSEPLRIYDAEPNPDVPFPLPAFSAMRLVEVGMVSPQLAVYRPIIDRWDIIYPLEREIERMAGGETVVEAPTDGFIARYALVQQPGALAPLNQNVAVVNEINGRRLIFGEGQGVVALSPRGSHYTQTDFTGFYVTNGETRVRLDIPAVGTSQLQWQVVWAPLIGTIGLVGSFRVEDGLLVIHTGRGDYNAGSVRYYALAPDGSSIVWVSEGSNNNARIRRYEWATDETTTLYDMPASDGTITFPRIVTYDGGRITLTDDLGALFVTNEGAVMRPAPPAEPVAASLRGPVLSPDRSKFAAIRYHENSYYYADLVVFDALTLETKIIYSQDKPGFFQLPVWDSYSHALLWPVYIEGEGPTVLQYDFNTDDVLAVSTVYPVVGDAGEVGMPDLVWWLPGEGYAVLLDTLDDKTFIAGYAADGSETRTQIGDRNYPAGCQFDKVMPVFVAGGQGAADEAPGIDAVAVHYPLTGAWKIIDPLTGAATWLDDGQQMRLVGGVQVIVRIPPAAREPADVGCEPGVFPDIDSRG